MEKKKFRVVLSATATVEGDNQADAAAALAIHLSSDYLMKDLANINIHVTREVLPKSTARAIAEAPYADQVTVGEDGVTPRPSWVLPPVTVEEDGSGLPPAFTAIAEETAAVREAEALTAMADVTDAPALTTAYTPPGPDEIPF